MSPEELLHQGRAILDPVMEPQGFWFRLTQVDRGSGGPFAMGEYVNGDWAVILHVRGALGIVEYRVGDATLEHRPFMQFLRVRQAAYPGFSEDPLDSFRHLRMDLERFAGRFLRREDREQFREFAARLAADPHCLRHLP